MYESGINATNIWRTCATGILNRVDNILPERTPTTEIIHAIFMYFKDLIILFVIVD